MQDYSSHDEEEGEHKQPETQQPLQLPVPLLLQDDSPQQPPQPPQKDHQGRIRSFPHVEGNYATHVYLPVPASLLQDTIDTVMQQLTEEYPWLVERLQPMELDAEGNYHISLSRVFPLRQHQIRPFVDNLTAQIAGKGRFVCVLALVSWFCNDESTRTFVSLEAAPCQPLQRLLSAVDGVVSSFGHAVYYRPARPHVSFAWALGNLLYRFNNTTTQLTAAEEVQLQYVHCKIGQHCFKITL